MPIPLIPGAPAPWFRAIALGGNADYAFDTVAGRPVVLLFAGSAGWPASAAALELLARYRGRFDDVRAAFFGVSIDPADVGEGRIAQSLPGIRWFLDHDRAVSRLYGASEDGGERYAPHWLLLDRALRVVLRVPIDEGARLFAVLDDLILHRERDSIVAPVLTVPKLLDAGLCRDLIDYYAHSGGGKSGFMREVDGITVEVHDSAHKRRRDAIITDEALLAPLRIRMAHVLRPLLRRAFQFDATRIERWLVSCYEDDEGGGHFRAHRDNTTRGTAHRRFACTINLNAGDYEGGDLRFPEYGDKTYRAPTGGAIVFSCALLHEALPVTRGRRFAFLPFLYDEPAARQREENVAHVAPELAGYRAGLSAEKLKPPCLSGRSARPLRDNSGSPSPARRNSAPGSIRRWYAASPASPDRD